MIIVARKYGDNNLTILEYVNESNMVRLLY